MSGICGIVSLTDGDAPAHNGAQYLAQRLEKLLCPLEARGPDGRETWIGDNAALGHTLLATTPEAKVEVLPLVDRATGCVITADARLDNRDALALALSVPLDGRVVGDGELILQAYLAWGDDCPKHLLGDFAFAIWDPRTQRLFAARDHMGARPLIYGQPDAETLVFGSMASALAATAPDTFPVRKVRIVEFLADFEGMDQHGTFFEGIFRLPPAHALRFDRDGLAISRYWLVPIGPPLELDSDEAYAKAFLDVFTEAVRCRLRASGPVATMLSGGMDSGAVTAVASRLLGEAGLGPLTTISAVSPDPATCDETRRVHRAWTMPGLRPLSVSHANLTPLLPRMIPACQTVEEPFDITIMLSAIYARAAEQGCKVVLDGRHGDIVVHGGDELHTMARRFQWLRLVRHVRKRHAFYDMPGSSRPFTTLLRALWRAFAPRPLAALRHRIRAARPRPLPDRPDLIDDALAKAMNWPRIARRFADAPDPEEPVDLERHGGPRTQQYRALFHPNGTVGIERYQRIAAAYAVEGRDPFLDIRVIELCLRLPADQLCGDGWPKLVLRRAMNGLMPDDLRWQTGKPHLGPQFTSAFFALWEGWKGKGAVLDRWPIPLSRVRSVLKQAEANQDSVSDDALTVFSLTIWTAYLSQSFRSVDN